MPRPLRFLIRHRFRIGTTRTGGFLSLVVEVIVKSSLWVLLKTQSVAPAAASIAAERPLVGSAR